MAKILIFFNIIIIVFLNILSAKVIASPYPARENRIISHGNTTYFIDPINGSDDNSGLKKESAWRTFVNLNRLFLSAGDRVEILAPASFEHTLFLMGEGASSSPVNIRFSPGKYYFSPAKTFKQKYHISNTNDAPQEEKALGILLQKAKYFNIEGPQAEIIYRGKMMELCLDGCENIKISGLSFDYLHPTVSEFKVAAAADDYADLQVHKDSRYKIENGSLIWFGENWQYRPSYAQELDLEENIVRRCPNPLKGLRVEEIAPHLLRVYGKHTMKKGMVYQFRDTRRDYAAVFTRRSKNIIWENLNFYFLHGMGLVSQFSENITFDKVSIAPRPGSGRTCAAWADCIQLSGCRGEVIIDSCTFSGSQDDAVNIHGTLLRVVQILSKNRVIVRFMHPQTYGFAAFNAGDDVTFIKWDKLSEYGRNKVKTALLMNEKEMLLTLEHPLPRELQLKDALENITWTPQVSIRNCRISRVPTRGFLITTRRKVIVEDNIFNKTYMSALLVEDDAKGWYESGCVRDMTIRRNKFICCGEPVVNINPQNSAPNDSVHQNIRIENNEFDLCGAPGIKVKSTSALIIKGNLFYTEKPLTRKEVIITENCSGAAVANNKYRVSNNIR